MSHIDNALKKAQEEKGNIYQRYSRIISVATHKNVDDRSKWVIAAAVVLVFFVVIVLLQFGDSAPDKKKGAIPYRNVVIKKALTSRQKTAIGAPAITVPLPDNSEKEKLHSPATVGDKGNVKKDTDTASRTHESGTHTNVANRDRSIPDASVKARQEESSNKLYKKALGYQQKSDLEKAEAEYKKILRIEPEHVFALNNLGVIYMSRKRNTDAAAMFERAIKYKNDYVNPYYNLACLYSQTGDIPRGLDYLRKAVRINNDVKDWAKSDRDLDRLRQSNGYADIMGKQPEFTEESSHVYVVREGDWIFDVIRKRFAISDEGLNRVLELIKKLNPAMRDTNIIYPGQRLKLPGEEDVERVISSYATSEKEEGRPSDLPAHN